MTTGLRRIVAVVLCASVTGCAATGGTRINTSPERERQITDPAVLAEYVQKLPPGSAVQVERRSGRTLRGTLMKATGTSVIVQPRTRIPERAIEIPLDEVLSVTPDSAGGRNTIARAIGAGAAAGAAAAVAVFLVILAMFDD